MSHNPGYVNFATAHNMDYLHSWRRILGDLKHYNKFSASLQRRKYAHRNAPSIYDLRENEIELAERIRRARRLPIIGGIVAVPFALVMFAAFVIFCAVM